MSTSDGYFNCRETPANFPSGLTLKNVPGSSTSVLRIISKIPGPGNYTGPTDFFFNINENPTTSIHFNGIMYNLGQSYLCFPGVHQIAGESKPCNAEMVLFFNPSQVSSIKPAPIIMCIPVESGIKFTEKSADYFSTLTAGVTARRPTLGAILPSSASFLSYRGFNFMLRLNIDSNLKKCEDIKDASTNIIQYLVCQKPIGMAVADYDRFTTLLQKKPRAPGDNDYTPLEQLVKPPKNINEVTTSRFTDLVTNITNVIIDASDVPKTIALNSKGIPINSMKCKRIQKGDKAGMRIDTTKKGESTLAQELITTQMDLNNMDLGELDPGLTSESPDEVKPGDIEKGIGIALGIVFGAVVCAFIAYWGMRLVFKNYTSGLKLYNGAPPSSFRPTPFKLPSLPALPKLCP